MYIWIYFGFAQIIISGVEPLPQWLHDLRETRVPKNNGIFDTRNASKEWTLTFYNYGAFGEGSYTLCKLLIKYAMTHGYIVVFDGLTGPEGAKTWTMDHLRRVIDSIETTDVYMY